MNFVFEIKFIQKIAKFNNFNGFSKKYSRSQFHGIFDEISLLFFKFIDDVKVFLCSVVVGIIQSALLYLQCFLYEI